MQEPKSAIPVGWVAAFAGRLIALAAVLAISIFVELRGTAQFSDRELTALYALVLVGFLLAAAIGALARFGGGRSQRVVAILEYLGDGLLLLGLIYCSGGARSPFGVLYLIWILHGAVRDGPRGIAVTTSGATLGYALAALGPVWGWLQPFEAGGLAASDEALSSFGMHAIGFLAIALLARRLAEQLERRQHELRELGELHARIFDNVASGLLTVDDSEHITSFNHEAARITGFDAVEVLGRPLHALFPTFRGHDSRAPQQRLELSFCNRAAQQLHLGFSRSLLRDDMGNVVGAVLIFQDLTHVHQMEQELRRSERLSAVGQLAAGLAHEIRNPLASLSGSLELLGDDLGEDDADSRRLLRIVKRETERLNRLVSDFLVYAGPGQIESEEVRVRELFEGLVLLLSRGEHAKLQVDLDVPAGLIAWGSSDQLQQVFWNLLLNAAQAEPDDGRIGVRARHGSDPSAAAVEIEVTDRGRGIPPETLERVFEPFFTTRGKGTGLGLALVHRVVEAHGGQIAVRSDEDGTTMKVVLPTRSAGT